MDEGTPQGGTASVHEGASEILTFPPVPPPGGALAHARERRWKEALEALLTRLSGVRSARVDTTPRGEVERIHVIADDRFSAAEQKRHIQSALLAAHDLEVDARRISLVPVKDLIEGDDATSPAGGARPRLAHISFEQDGFKTLAHVELDWEGRTYHGLSQDADTPKGRMMAAGRASLRALEKIADHRAAFFLEALDGMKAFRRQVTVASVQVLSDRLRVNLVGCATLGDDPSHAAVQAVLAAVNRSFARLIAPPLPLANDDDAPSEAR